MKLMDMINLSIKKIFRNKQNLYYIPITVLSIILFIISLMITENVESFIEKSQNNNVGFRTLNIAPNYNEKDFGMEILKNVDDILEVYSSKYSGITLESNLKNKNVNGKIGLLYGSNNTLPKVEIGKTFDDSSVGVAICPINFSPDDGINELKINKKYIMSPSNSLNSTFEVTYYSYSISENTIEIKETFKKQFKIIGLYDNKKTINMNNECYVTSKDLIEIMDKNYLNVNDNTLYSQYAVINKLENVNKTISYLKENGFDDVSTKISIDKSFFDIIIYSAKIILLFVILLISIVSFFYNKKKYINESKEIGLYKALGFSKKNIIKLYLYENLIVNIFSFVIALIIYLFLFYYLKYILLYSFQYIGIDIVNYNFFFIITFILFNCFCLFISFLEIYRIIIKNSSELIGCEEI